MKVDPDAAGLDAGRLSRIGEHIASRYIGPGKIAGCHVAVARHGAVGYSQPFGLMDAERGVAVGDDTIWRIYSMTKPITGVALMTLYERGLFQLDDPVDRFIPSWRGLQVEERQSDGSTTLVDAVRPPSVKDVLMHMAGLGFGLQTGTAEEGGIARPTIMRDPGLTLERLADRVAERPLAHQPGTRWVYGLQTDICARLVEVLSGRRFDNYLRTEIFEPLGMADTGFTVPAESADRFAGLYRRGPDKRFALMEDAQQSSYLRERSFLSGGGGLVSTTGDYLRFAQMLLNGGELDGRRILGRKTVELMTVNHLPGGAEMRAFSLPGGYGEVGFDGTGFGLTMAIGLGPARTGVIGSAGEFMWGGAASTIFWVDPKEDMVVVFMTQLMPSGSFNFRGQLKALVYPAIVD